MNADEEEHVLIIDDWADEKSPLQSPVPSSGTRTPAYTPPRKEVTFSRQPTVHVIDTPPKSPTPPSTSRQSSLMSRFNEMMTKKEEEKVRSVYIYTHTSIQTDGPTDTHTCTHIHMSICNMYSLKFLSSIILKHTLEYFSRFKTINLKMKVSKS